MKSESASQCPGASYEEEERRHHTALGETHRRKPGPFRFWGLLRNWVFGSVSLLRSWTRMTPAVPTLGQRALSRARSTWWNKGYSEKELWVDPEAWDEVVARRRLLLRVACGAACAAVAAALYFALPMSAKAPKDFEFRGVRVRQAISPEFRLDVACVLPGTVCYERPEDRLYLGRVPLDRIRYYFDLDKRLLRLIVIGADKLRYGDGAFDIVSEALSAKIGLAANLSRIRLDSDPGKAAVSFSRRIPLESQGIELELRQECSAISQFSDLRFDTLCDMTLRIEDSHWAGRREGGGERTGGREEALLGAKDL